MKQKTPATKFFGLIMIMAFFSLILTGCQEPPKTEMVKTVQIPEGEIDPTAWGKAYPIEYDLWKKTEQPLPAGKSKYKKGFDADHITYDKLSEFPYMALLYNGWGFGIGYNEPRGHAFMVRDQLEIDSSRVKSGGACLTCKTPYFNKLERELGEGYYKGDYKAVVDKIPEHNRNLGVACIDCHNSKDMSLQLSREITLGKAMKAMNVDRSQITRQDMRSLVCAQCHVTYIMARDKDMKVTEVFFPWKEGKWPKISVEDIIKVIRSSESHNEWKQAVTGFKVGYIRHPEFELYAYDSIHYKAGVSCADCHMPYTKVGTSKVSDHRVASPLKSDLKACSQCHAEGPEWLREQVFNIQDRTVSMMIRSGYANATTAKLFEKVHNVQKEGKTIDMELYNQAKDYYLEGFYRTVFVGAENSIGFHNPPEAIRILGDSVAFAMKAESLLRQALTKAGVEVPIKVDLELMKYVDERGKDKVKFKPEQEFKDPFNLQVKF